jgi:hypothetical protein
MLFAWLDLDHVGEISKDEEQFAGFDQQLVSDLRASLVAFLDDVVWSETSDYRQLFQADWTMTTERLAEFYGDAWQPAEAGHGVRRSVSREEISAAGEAGPAHRYGLLTHPYLMSGLAYHDSTSPIHRGVFLIRYVLGRNLRPPNDSFTPLSPDLHPDLTTRERVALQTSPESCQVCHRKINGLGFTLENFDAVGRFRDKERGKPIDPRGRYTDRSGNRVEFGGPAELAAYLAGSEDAMHAFVTRVFQHFVKQPIAAYGTDTERQLVAKVRDSGCNIRQLLVEVAVIAATQSQTSNLEAS